MFIEGSLTTLAQDLKPGDTTVYLTDASGFDSSKTAYYHKGFIFWNYKNSYGYQYPPETYSRHKYSNLWTNGSTAIDKTNNTITLDKAWTGPTFPAGTSVSQCSDGNTYSYGNDNFYIKTTEWVRKTATWSGVGRNNESHKFREGTAFVRLGWLINYSGAADTINKISTIELTKNAGISKVNNAQSTADNAQSTADTAKANAATAQSTADTAKANAAAAQTAANTANTTANAARDKILSWCHENNQTLIDGAKIYTDSIDAESIDVESLTADAAFIDEMETNLTRFKAAGDNEYYETEITGEGIDFKYGTSEENAKTIAGISGDELQIKKTSVLDEMKIGKWSWKVNPNNSHLTLRWNGGDE